MEEIRKRLNRQASRQEVEKVGDIVTQRLLERIPNYYAGGATGLLNRIIKRLGGHFVTAFRLGYAGFGFNQFYISYDYYDSTFKHVKVEYKTVSDDLFLTSHDIDTIVNGLMIKVEDYLEEFG
ncbi:hypothetical protein ACVRZP_05505 [Streptococcus gallolyticus subsp. gallolyticus]|uniref:Uncharacterized protein n=1 Tax=Streptococcus gallolyticus (strain UCN34) TaxID=637909 RepID=A0AA36NQL0_STRG3|nr:hypothetical protein [Streptococcus gallolyticus]MCO7177440.1 hypothetical protein [Streptococcus gallolyticus]CBI14152.1 hypothetical protein GALLO_1661 [Streptococcus gallolyticus UCN34]